jgi:hypothetical protein
MVLYTHKKIAYRYIHKQIITFQPEKYLMPTYEGYLFDKYDTNMKVCMQLEWFS